MNTAGFLLGGLVAVGGCVRAASGVGGAVHYATYLPPHTLNTGSSGLFTLGATKPEGLATLLAPPGVKRPSDQYIVLTSPPLSDLRSVGQLLRSGKDNLARLRCDLTYAANPGVQVLVVRPGQGPRALTVRERDGALIFAREIGATVMADGVVALEVGPDGKTPLLKPDKRLQLMTPAPPADEIHTIDIGFPTEKERDLAWQYIDRKEFTAEKVNDKSGWQINLRSKWGDPMEDQDMADAWAKPFGGECVGKGNG